MKLLWEQHW